MKQLLMAVAVCLTMTACEKAIEVEELGQQTEVEMPDGTVAKAKKFTFTMKGDFSDDWKTTRGYLAADGRDMTDVWVLDYMNGQLVQQLHQSDNTAEDFGKPQMSLAYGSHHVYFVASRGTEPTIEGTTMQWVKPSDTFWKDLELNVTATTANSRTVELDRVVTRIRVVATDEVPADVATVAVTPAMWYYGIDYRTGEPAVARQDNERSVAVLASYIGTQGTLAVNIFGFSGAEWTTDVTVTSKRSDGTVISSATVSDVPFKKNRSTEMIGAVFAKVGVNTITLNDEWLNAFGVEF